MTRPRRGDSAAKLAITTASLCVLLLIASGCDKPRTGVVPLPTLPDKIELRVVHVINPRLPRMTEAQVGKLLSAAKDGVKEHFGRDISFGQTRAIPIGEFFDVGRIPEDKRKRIENGIYDFKTGKGNRHLMVKSFAQRMEEEKLDLREAIGFAAPYFETTLTGRDYQAFADALVTTQLKRLDEWKDARTVDGESVIDKSKFNEILYWEGLTQAGYPVDVILTNQLLAGAEYWGNSVHSALRGGISNGVTEANPSALFKATAIVSTYPMIGSDSSTRKLRDGEVYTDEEAVRFAALVLVHEIGHQLFHFDHPYGVSACVMAPTKLLYFRQWESGLSAEECHKAKAAAMVRGAVSIPCDSC